MFGFRRIYHLIDDLAQKLDTRADRLNAALKSGFGIINDRLDKIEEQEKKIMATVADLDVALDDFGVALDASIAEVSTAVQDILSKVGGAVDLTAEIDRIKAAQAKMTAAADDVKALDVGTVTPTAPPIVGP